MSCEVRSGACVQEAAGLNAGSCHIFEEGILLASLPGEGSQVRENGTCVARQCLRVLGRAGSLSERRSFILLYPVPLCFAPQPEE